jgi:NAD(P)-dependent dehydrogenase (short-subunit alcohol dehydrogenase family)
MSAERKVAVITGASQGIGAALVKAYRDRNYRVVATARSIKPSSDPDILAVPGDIAERKTAERVISEGVARFGGIDTLECRSKAAAMLCRSVQAWSTTRGPMFPQCWHR